MNVTSIPAAPFFSIVLEDRCSAQVGKGLDRQRFRPGRRAHATRMRMLGLVFLSVAGLGGCHVSTSFLDNHQFMEAWSTYLHCRASAEPDEIAVDLQRLSAVSSRHAQSLHNHSSILVLPVAMRSLVATRPSRVAVDPHAMSVACALHGSEVAKAAGLPRLSVVPLTAVTAAQLGAVNASYAVEARHRLEGVEW